MAEIDDFLAESKKSGGFFGIGGSKPVSKTSEVDEFLAQKRGEGGSNILRRAVVDPLVGVAQGTLVGLPEAAVGLANIPTLGGAGKMVENVARGIGVPTFDEANERFKSLLSPETREAERKVAEAEGFVGTLKAGLANPSAPVQTIMQSIPAMFGGAAAGRAIVTALGKAPLSGKALTEALTAAGGPSSAAGKALLKSNMAKAVTAGAVGEGLVSAGQNVEQLRQEMTSGLITPQQAMIMSGSGFATGLITKMSGGLASRLKIVDVDTLLQGVNTAGHIELKILPVLKALAWSAISEGAIEELPQSAQETFASNVAAGRPPFDGVPEAAAMGLLAGVGMGLGGGGGAVIRQYIQDQDPNNRKINQLMEEIGGEELEAVKVPGFITGSEAATVPITPGEQALPEEAMVEDQAGNMLEEELAAIEAPPLEELSGEVQAIEAAPAEVAPIGTPLEALPQIEAAPAIEAAPLQPALEAPVAPVEAPAIQEAASIAPHPEIAPAAIEAAMPPAAEAPVIPPAPQAIPAPAASVPGIPDVFMQMPMETLQQMADNGVAGAKAALPIRLQQAAAPIAPPVPPVPQQAAPAIPAAQPPVPAKAAEVSTFKRKKDFSYSGEYSFTVNGENWKAYRDADAGNLHAWFAAKEGDDFPRQSSLYSKKELIDRIESGEYYKGGPDYVPSAGTPAPAPPAPVAKSSATRKQLKEMGEDPDYLLKEIRGADDLQGVDEQNYNQAIARGESGSIEISQAESVRKLRLAEATKEISKKRKTPQAPAPAPPAAPAPPVTSAAEAKTRIAGKKVSAEAKALTGQIAQVEAALADREKKIKAGEKAKKDMSSAKKAQSVQQHYLAKIKKDLADLSAKEAAPKKTKSPVQDEIDAAEDSVKLLEKELTKAQKDYDEAVRLARPKKEIKILGNTRDDIKKEIADVKKELSRLTKKPSFTREDQAAGAGLLAERAQSIVDKVLGFLKNPPPVRVLADINTFINSDDPMGKRLKAYMVENEMLDEDGGDSRTVGFFWEGTTYIVAGNISTPQGVVNTLAHELTHNGLGRLLDSQKGMPGIGSIRLKRDILMDKIYHAHTADIKEIAATTHQHLDLSKAEGRRQAAEEWVCNQSYEAQPKWYDKLVALFHDAMRALGINTKITDAEVRVVLGDAFKEFGYRAGEPQSGGPADSPLFQISKAKALRAVPYKILRPDEIPEKTQKAYKLMKVFDGVNLLFPLYADAPTGEQPRGFKLNEWHKAEVANIKMATRPGLHAVDLPIFSQGKVGGLKDNIKRVWVEVLMPAMNQKTQAEADATELLGNGQREGIRKRLIGVDEAYNFKTSNNAQGAGSWPVAGSMNPARILHDKEVAQILKAAGKSEFVENSMTGISNTTAQMLNDQLMGSGEPQFSRTQINTPAFKNWFGSSKVVNKNGEPLVVYHGTRTSPVKFKKIMGMFGHFGTIAAANDKLEWDAHRPGEHAVMPVYLSLQNPVRMEDVHFDEYGTMAEDLVESGALSKKDLPLAWEKRYGNLDTKYITQLIDVLKSKGYDGIVYENRVESPGEDSWIPFAATQIKSATGNVGAFAKANPDIRFARGTGFENRNYGSRVLSGEESVPGSVPPFLSDVATYLEDISKKDGRVDHRTATRKQKEQIVGAVKEMLRASVKRYPESLGWYKKDLETTMDILTDIYPELKKPSNHFRMRLAIALSSNGNDTTTNIEIARKIYESFRDSGIMESDVKASRAKAIRESLRLADILRGTFKSEKAFEDWLLGSAYIGDLQSDVAARLKITRKEAAGIVGGTEGQDTFLPRAIIFGPKVGVFFTNLSGDFSQITMDRWFMRTMGRLTGILVEGGKKSEVIAQRERFTEAMKASPGGVRLSQIQEDLYSSGRSIDKAAAKISKLSMKDNFRELLNNVPGGEELRHAANNRNKYINGAMPIDSPSSGAHRQWLRDIVNEAREGLEKEGLSYENADIQAAIWIGEKELYKTFGVKGKRGDYYSTGAEVLYERVHGRPSGRHAGIAGRVVERGRGKLGQTLPLFSRTPDNIIEKIKDLALNSPDGFTINVADGTAQTTGYAVAPSKLTETRVKKLTERNLTEFIDRYGDVFEKDTRAFLGGWHDSNTKEIVLDISFVVDDLADALYIADIGDQIAIFHLDNFEEIGREDGIKGLKEAGVYSQGRRDELGGIQESLHKAIQGSGVAGGRAGEPSFTRTAGRVRTAGQRVERKGVTRSSGQELIDQGTHYSNQQRGRLDSKFYGTGLADAASRRLPSDPKSPLRQRIHFYYDPGTGMPKAEVGVGTYAHNADLSQYKIYNLSSGKIKVDRVEGEHVLNTFEKAIMKAGFDGFSSPDYGVVVLIGKRTVPVEPQFSRISSQEDAAYLKAVESGDMEIAQKMVDEAAKAAGYNVEAWHGGAKGINEFVPSVEGMYGAGIYTGGNEDYITKEFASQGQWLYGKFVPASKVYHVYLKMDNPLTVVTPVDVVEAVDGKVAAKEMSDKHGGPYELILDGGYTRDLQKKGYDGIIADNEWGRENIVFNPNQIKSADAITYNDKGNVTPLSERFSEESPDIRFSRTEEEAARKAGAEFSGFYETPAFGNKPARKIPTYNDPETGATFALNKGETIEQGLARKRAEFKKAADRPGAETVTEPSESTAAPAISDRVLFSIAAGASVPPGNDATWNAPVKSAMSSLWYTLVDKHADLRDVTTAIEKFSGTIGDVVNASLKETLFSGRVAKRVENYLEGELRPVLKELSNKNIDLSDFEEYLHFRHAEEANDYVKTLVDDKGKVVGMQDGGSGKTYQQIKDYFAGLDKGLAGRMESVAVKVDAMTRENARLMAEYRLESQATIDKWFGTYQHYVPLFREHVSEARMGTGTGLTVTGSITRKRKGSEKSVVNVLANIANQRERVIASGEKNIIATALYGLAKMHPNAEFWRVIKPGVKKVLDLKTKEMIWTPDFDYKKKTNVVMSRQFDKDGNIVERGIEFSIENERARRMADSIRNIDMDTLGLVLGTSAKVTRFIASMNTQYNPVFGVTNFVRDVGTAMFNLTTTPIAGRQKEMMGHALPALKGIYEAIRAQRAGKPFSSEWAKLFDEFQTHGGQTGYRDLYKTTDERSRRLEREINMMKGGTALKAGSAVMGWLSDYNTAMENAIRLSAYKVGIDNGMSKDQSAAMAKSLTVNFNRKGQIATQAGSLYAFFNASAQGISKVYETLTGPAGKRVIAGGLLFGVMQAAVLAAAGMGDDEPPEFVQEKNIVIPISGGKYITIPMPLGFNVLPNIGRMSAQFAMSGFERPFDRMANLFGVILDGFNPLGASKTLLQTISPTPIDPLVALAENKDWTGKPIYREDFSSLHPTPGFTRTKDTATWGGKGLAWGLNMLTGGTRATPGFFSPTPDQIDYLFGQATGGVGRETAKLQQTAAALATGDEVPAYKIPLGSRFFGSTTGGPYEATKYYNNLKMMNQHEDEIKDLKKHREPIMEYMADNPKAKLWTLSNKTESTINKLKKRKQDMIARGAKGESIKTIDALIATHMKRFNDTIAAAK